MAASRRRPVRGLFLGSLARKIAGAILTGFRLTHLALSDLDGIAAYSAERWGVDRAVRYLTRLDDMFNALVQSPWLGKDRGDVRSGLLCVPCERHVIFFRRDSGGGVEVLRILHERMDFQRHL